MRDALRIEVKSEKVTGKELKHAATLLQPLADFLGLGEVTVHRLGSDTDETTYYLVAEPLDAH